MKLLFALHKSKKLDNTSHGKSHAMSILTVCNVESYSIARYFACNGALEAYVKSHHGQISLAKRLYWMPRATEALHLLHPAGVIYCDIGPYNPLLDLDMNLKIADFSHFVAR